nr:PfkB family carbohydrate kinase [Longimicrobium terrae]
MPDGRFAGGAPLNVAYHLTRCGVRALPVTAVGDDEPGRALVEHIRASGCDTARVSVVPGAATGEARAELAADGSARYSFGAVAAWDLIPAADAPAGVAAVIHGTLALREEHNRAVLRGLLASASAACRVYDVNLRPPYDDPAFVLGTARGAGLLKVNDDELRRLLGVGEEDGSPERLESLARALGDRAGCRRVCVTAGARGAGLLWDGAWMWEAGRPVRVVDTVGAGDAFLARLVQRVLLDGAPPHAGLRDACRLGEFVAASRGATPAYRLLPGGTVRAPGAED